MMAMILGTGITKNTVTALEPKDITVKKEEQQYIVEENATYWESSEKGGSGKHNNVTAENPYISEDRVITINGISYLDEDGKILFSTYVEYKDMQGAQAPKILEMPEGTTKRMYHICTGETDLGWIDIDQVTKKTLIEESKKEEMTEVEETTPEKFAEIVDSKKGKTLIYVDQSGSMYYFTQEAMRAFNQIDLEDKTIIVFANKMKEIEKKDIKKEQNTIGISTNIYGNLNKSVEYSEVENLIIITDLEDNHGEELLPIKSLKTVEIYCPNANYPKENVEYIKEVYKKASVRVNIIK